MVVTVLLGTTSHNRLSGDPKVLAGSHMTTGKGTEFLPLKLSNPYIFKI